MLSLIRDILNYSQLSKERHFPSKIDLNKVIESIRDDFELLIEEKKATIVAGGSCWIQRVLLSAH